MIQSLKDVLVIESGEVLVDVRQFCRKIAFKKNGHEPILRLGAAARLNIAADLLPDEITFIFNSGWRSQRDQEAEFKNCRLLLKKMNPTWSLKKVKVEAGRFVAPSIGPRVSGHLTGGAVDLGLVFRKTGQKVPLTASELTFEENSRTKQPKLPKSAQCFRQMMFRALATAGFVNVSHEFWHWSYGDRTWAQKKDQVAIYDIKVSFP